MRRAGAIMQVARILLNCLAMADLLVVAATANAADPEVMVGVASGRQFRGMLDSTSSSEYLVLRAEQAGITLRRPICWERVASATADGVPIDVAELRKMAIARQSAPTNKPT